MSKLIIEKIKILAPKKDWSEARQAELNNEVMDVVNRHNKAVENHAPAEEVTILFSEFVGLTHGLHFADVYVWWRWEKGKTIH